MHRMAHALLVTTVALFLALPAHAQEADATRLYNEGWRLYKDKQYAEACPLLERSLAASPKIRTRGALALCYEATGRLASAYSTWRAVADQAHEAGAVEAASLKRAVEKSEQLLPKHHPGRVPGGRHPVTVQVWLDGRPLTASELRAQVPVDPGEHKIEAKAPDRVDWQSSFEIVAADAGKTRSVPIGPLAPIERVEQVELPPGTPTTERPSAGRPDRRPVTADASPQVHRRGDRGRRRGRDRAGHRLRSRGEVEMERRARTWAATTTVRAGRRQAPTWSTTPTPRRRSGPSRSSGESRSSAAASPCGSWRRRSSAVTPEVSIGPNGAQLGVKGSF